MKDYQAAPDLLKDRIILVTGAGDGIGRVAAKAYANHGATVILLGRTVKKLEAVYDEIEQSGGPQPAIVPTNLEDSAAENYLAIADAIGESFDRLDGVLHNAGLLGQRTPIANYDPNNWMQVMQVNLNAPFLLTQALLPLNEQCGGRINHLYLLRGWPQRPRLLGRLRRLQIRHRGPDADPGR